MELWRGCGWRRRAVCFDLLIFRNSTDWKPNGVILYAAPFCGIWKLSTAPQGALGMKRQSFGARNVRIGYRCLRGVATMRDSICSGEPVQSSTSPLETAEPSNPLPNAKT